MTGIGEAGDSVERSERPFRQERLEARLKHPAGGGTQGDTSGACDLQLLTALVVATDDLHCLLALPSPM